MYTTTIQMTSTKSSAVVRYVAIPAQLSKAAILSARAAFDGSVTNSKCIISFIHPTSSNTVGTITPAASVAAGTVKSYVRNTSVSLASGILTSTQAIKVSMAKSSSSSQVNPTITIQWDAYCHKNEI